MDLEQTHWFKMSLLEKIVMTMQAGADVIARKIVGST